MRKHGFLAFVVLNGFVACDTLPSPDRGPFDVALPPPVTVISLESELLGHPTDLAVAPDGRLWVADARSHRLLTVAPDGSDPAYIGQEGEGPGEFRSPTAVVAGQNRIRVIDTVNGRVQDFTPDGTHISDWLSPVPLYSGPSAVDLSGRLITSSSGSDSALAMVRFIGDSGSAPVLRLGPIVTQGPAFFDMVSIKNRIAEGNIPVELRNSVIPIAGNDGITWLLVQTEAEVRKYGADGTLLWQRILDVPELEAARSDFFRRNAEDDNPARFFNLVTMRDAVEVEGALWILLWAEQGAPAVFLLLDAESGRTLGRVSVPVPDVANRLAIDPDRDRLYIAIADEASVLAADITGVPW